MWEGTNYRFETYIETFDLKTYLADPKTQPKISSEFVIAATPRDIDKEISFWNMRHGTRDDLLLRPDVVLESLHYEGDLIHLSEKSQAFFRYNVSVLRGIRSLDLGFGDFRIKPDENFRVLPDVPPETRAYAYPFFSKAA